MEKVTLSNESNNLSAPNIPQQLCKILKCPECYNIPQIFEKYNGYYTLKCRNAHEKS